MKKTTIVKMGIAVSALLVGNVAIAGGDIQPMEPVVEAPKVMMASSKPKRQMKGNMTLKYNVLPGSADTISEMFSKGIFYGRLRSNTFYWDWKERRCCLCPWSMFGSTIFCPSNALAMFILLALVL